MARRFPSFGVLVVAACLVGAQVHVSAEFDPCLWSVKHSQLPLPGHNSGHGCHGCMPGNWAMAAPAPPLAQPVAFARLEVQNPRFALLTTLAEASSPRAPPVA